MKREKRTQLVKSNTSEVSSWDDVADWYDHLLSSRGNSYHKSVIIPGVERMLRHLHRDMQGVNLLDIACGQGALCRHMADLGARVTGMDLSAALLQRARSHRSTGSAPVYLQGNATELLDSNGKLPEGIEAGSYDAVTLVMAVQNMSPLSPIWKGIQAALAPKGAVVIVMMHPCFRLPQRSDWRWNSQHTRQERVIWQYLTSEEITITIHPGRHAAGKPSAEVVHYHRPLQAYINTLGNSGLLVDHMEEWCSHKTDEEGIKKEALDRARKEFPLFLALRARKVVFI
jgi:2-polyprenyl-3-methyl-5-hydroxy-6-metoxy-1,4-benzoquinol methylase